MEEFGQMILQHFMERIEEQYPAINNNIVINPTEQQRLEHNTFMTQRSEVSLEHNTFRTALKSNVLSILYLRHSSQR